MSPVGEMLGARSAKKRKEKKEEEAKLDEQIDQLVQAAFEADEIRKKVEGIDLGNHMHIAKIMRTATDHRGLSKKVQV